MHIDTCQAGSLGILHHWNTQRVEHNRDHASDMLRDAAGERSGGRSAGSCPAAVVLKCAKNQMGRAGEKQPSRAL